MVDGCEILHQIGGFTIIDRLSTIPGGAGILPSTVVKPPRTFAAPASHVFSWRLTFRHRRWFHRCLDLLRFAKGWISTHNRKDVVPKHCGLPQTFIHSMLGYVGMLIAGKVIISYYTPTLLSETSQKKTLWQEGMTPHKNQNSWGSFFNMIEG